MSNIKESFSTFFHGLPSCAGLWKWFRRIAINDLGEMLKASGRSWQAFRPVNLVCEIECGTLGGIRDFASGHQSRSAATGPFDGC